MEDLIKVWKGYQGLDDELKEQLAHASSEELEDAFYTDLKFGTGGLRGIIGVGTNRMNIYVIRKTTYGFVQYLKRKYPDYQERGVAISYDCRHHSKDFAMQAAMVLATSGIQVYLFTNMRPTPELSFTVRHLNCCGGIMITASHNPPKYNGYKVYDHTGCQLLPEACDEVTAEVDKIENIFSIETLPFDELKAAGKIHDIGEEIDKVYLEKVKTVRVNKVDAGSLKVVFTPLHGTSSVSLPNLLKEEGFNVFEVREQMVPDPDFSTLKLPNPEDQAAFAMAAELGNKVDADILIATDPDADRLGVAIRMKDGGYYYLTGNQTGALILSYLAQYRKRTKPGVVFNTIVTSNMAKAICDKYGLELVQTLTGFKYIGAKATELEHSDKEFFFGYEESYGYVLKDFVHDKDSLQSSLIVCEMAAFYKRQGKTLIDVLYDLFKEFGYYREGVYNITLEGQAGIARIEAIMNHFMTHPVNEITGKKVAIFEDYRRLLRFSGKKQTPIDLPQTSAVKFIFDDGGWFALRPSGTEPKLKIYFAIVAKTEESAMGLISKLQTEMKTIIEGIQVK